MVASRNIYECLQMAPSDHTQQGDSQDNVNIYEDDVSSEDAEEDERENEGCEDIADIDILGNPIQPRNNLTSNNLVGHGDTPSTSQKNVNIGTWLNTIHRPPGWRPPLTSYNTPVAVIKKSTTQLMS